MKIMKRLAAVLLLWGLGYTTMWAQWSYGVKGGLNASKLKWEAWDPKFKIGVQVGGFAAYHFSEGWSLQAELLYALQGCRFEVWESLDEDKKFMAKDNLHYLNIPVLARFQFASGLFFELGPQVGFLLGEFQKYKDERHRMEDTKPVDLALAGGVGYAFNEHWEWNFRYVHGFLPTRKYLNDDCKPLNRSMQLSLGYRF